MLSRFCIWVAVLTLLAPAVRADEHAGDRAHWVATWSAGMQTSLFAEPQVIQNQTLRQIVRISRGGSAVRVRFSNALGTTPLKIDAASVAIRASGAAVVAGTLQPLRFAGKASIMIPPRAVVVSDAVQLATQDQADLAISSYLSGPAPATTQKTQSLQTSFVSGAGDFTASETFTPDSTISAWYWLSGVEVQRRHARAIVAFGDSITEGYGSTLDANARWPDVLARRLIAAGDPHSVVDTGIGGNRVLNDEIGPNAISRLDPDLVTQTGAEYAILLEAINDIGVPTAGGEFLPPTVSLAAVSVDDIVAGYQQIIRRAHAAGITIYGATLTPIGGSSYDNPENEAKRQSVNAWIRSSGAFDGTIDFDAAVRDPDQTGQLLAAFDSGDRLHPNDAGYAAMAEAIDLQLFQAAPHYPVCR